MPVVISAELILALQMLISNLIGASLKSLEGKTVEEIQALSKDDSALRKLLMEQMHSTDKS
jgi:hypothetical protein